MEKVGQKLQNLTKRELVVPFAHAQPCAPVSLVRSTLITASLLNIRECGWETRYYQALPQPLHATFRALVAGQWLPIEASLAHYRALDTLSLSPAEIGRAGEAVSTRIQKSFAATLLRATREVGVTPWVLFARTQTIWERVFTGGDLAVYKTGPKDANIEVVANALLGTAFFRIAIVSHFRILTALAARTVFAKELEGAAGETSLVLRISWV